MKTSSPGAEIPRVGFRIWSRVTLKFDHVLQEFLAEDTPAVEEESYPEPTAPLDDVIEQVRHPL